MNIFPLKSHVEWVFLQFRVKYETKIYYHTALLVAGNTASAAVVSCLHVLFSERFCQKANWLLRGRLLILNIV